MKLRYKRSMLGIAWSLVAPLSQALVLLFVFGTVLPLEIPNYAVFLLTGILPWTWFHVSLLDGSLAVVSNRDLIQVPRFPVALLPIVSVTAHLIHFLLALPILLSMLHFCGFPLRITILAVPAVIVVQFLLTVGMASMLAALHVVFDDTRHLLSITLMLCFYVTPVFYDATSIPERYRMAYQLNPMAHLLRAYRGSLMNGQWPSLWLLPLGIASLGLSALALRILVRAHHRFVEEL
jgi:lipopolysaccharide transport system permease protein